MIDLPPLPPTNHERILCQLIEGNIESVHKLTSVLPQCDTTLRGKIQEEIKRIEAQTREAQETLSTYYLHNVGFNRSGEPPLRYGANKTETQRP